MRFHDFSNSDLCHFIETVTAEITGALAEALPLTEIDYRWRAVARRMVRPRPVRAKPVIRARPVVKKQPVIPHLAPQLSPSHKAMANKPVDARDIMNQKADKNVFPYIPDPLKDERLRKRG